MPAPLRFSNNQRSTINPEDVELVRNKFKQAEERDLGWYRTSPRFRIIRAYRQLRTRVYMLLERSAGTMGFLYHLTVFFYIILVHSLSALVDLDEYQHLLEPVRQMEVSLVGFFTVEFLARMWSVGANGKYQGLKGRLLYLRRPVCIVDMLILSVTLFVVLAEQSVVPAGLEKLRFIQILRLFHIDRQMTTWKLIKKMVERSKYELMAAYYIVFMVFLLLSVAIYTIETLYEDWEQEANTDADVDRTFNNFGEAFWFSVITVFTVGYGDIVPRQWQSKFIVCIFSYIGLSMFATASGLVGIGMSLMLENQNKLRQESKVRNMAARVIQSWYRFHLLSDSKRFEEIHIYSKFSAKLQDVEDRIRKARRAARKAMEKQEAE
ncbi:KQT-2 protein [Aphelenchoides avenae]|nr:KQT-2 protein [Aphelenchus avenae]